MQDWQPYVEELGRSARRASEQLATLSGQTRTNALRQIAESIRAAQTLETEGISARVIDMHTIKPLDRDAITRAAAETGAIVVSEEHLTDAGLGVRVAQVVAETHPVVMEFIGVNSYAESATPDQLLDKYGLRALNVAAAARRAISRKR